MLDWKRCAGSLGAFLFAGAQVLRCQGIEPLGGLPLVTTPVTLGSDPPTVAKRVDVWARHRQPSLYHPGRYSLFPDID